MSIAQNIESTHPTDSALTPENIYTVADTIGVVGKLATLAMLDKTPSDYVSRAGLRKRLDDAQGTGTGLLSRTSPFEYCRGVFKDLGLVEIGTAKGLRGPVRGARITQAGSELWPAIAGAYLPWQQENPRLFLSDILGHSQQALMTGTSTRIEIIKFLLDQPEGVAAPTEIMRGIERSASTTSTVTSELARIGLLAYRSKHKPEERTFRLSDSTEMIERYKGRMSAEMRASIEVLMSARRNDGVELIDGLTIIKMVKEHAPELDSKHVWDQFLGWMKSSRTNEPFLEEVTFATNHTQRTLLSVAAKHKAPLADFLARREKLATDDEFRLDAEFIGRDMFAEKRFLSRALHDVKINSPHQTIDATKWELNMFEYVPSEGIELKALHNLIQKMTGSQIHQKSFRKRLFGMTNLLTFSTVSDPNDINVATLVKLREQSFPANWAEDARCNSKNIAPQIFSPDDATSQSEKRAGTAEALSHCTKCLGRMACLKTAVERKETDHIQGALTPDQLQKLSRRQKTRIRDTITIESRFNSRPILDRD